MIRGMKTTKIAVSLPPQLVLQARRAVRRGLAPSVSAYVAGALEERAKLDDLTQMLDDMLAESGGPMTGDERREAEAALGVRKPRKRRSAA
jgi:Arc/MetJ-type ribon-helix-helix transcriptional regulator